jgi:hypothetical protein
VGIEVTELTGVTPPIALNVPPVVIDTEPAVGLAKRIPKFQSLSCVNVIGGFEAEAVELAVCAEAPVTNQQRTTTTVKSIHEHPSTSIVELLREHLCLALSIPKGRRLMFITCKLS